MISSWPHLSQISAEYRKTGCPGNPCHFSYQDPLDTHRAYVLDTTDTSHIKGYQVPIMQKKTVVPVLRMAHREIDMVN